MKRFCWHMKCKLSLFWVSKLFQQIFAWISCSHSWNVELDVLGMCKCLQETNECSSPDMTCVLYNVLFSISSNPSQPKWEHILHKKKNGCVRHVPVSQFPCPRAGRFLRLSLGLIRSSVMWTNITWSAGVRTDTVSLCLTPWRSAGQFIHWEDNEKSTLKQITAAPTLLASLWLCVCVCEGGCVRGNNDMVTLKYWLYSDFTLDKVVALQLEDLGVPL